MKKSQFKKANKKEQEKKINEYGLFEFLFPSDVERKMALDLSGESTLLKKIILTDLNNFYFRFNHQLIIITLIIFGYYHIKNLEKHFLNF